jgi:hypothetical protein
MISAFSFFEEDPNIETRLSFKENFCYFIISSFVFRSPFLAVNICSALRDNFFIFGYYIFFYYFNLPEISD